LILSVSLRFIFYPFPKRKDVIFKSWRVGRRRSKRGCSTLLIGETPKSSGCDV